MATPALVLVLVFVVLPIAFTVLFSVAKGPGFGLTGFVGLKNFLRLLSDSRFFDLSDFSGALVNSLLWMVVAVPVVMVIGFVVALIAEQSRHEGLVRSAFFLPMVISGTAVSIIWLFVYAPSPQVGLLNAATGGTQSWLGDPNTVNVSLMAAWIWGQTGISVVIIAAALKGVPTDMIEAARIDGANSWRIFWQITLPAIRIPLSFLLTTQLVQVLKVFDVVFVMTQGGPAGSSRTLAMYFYETTFLSTNPQYGAAIVLAMSLLIGVAFWAARRVTAGGSNAA
jgi:alpha-glucoside transport system permease protein